MDEKLLLEIFNYLRNSGEFLASEAYKYAYQQVIYYGWGGIILSSITLIGTILSFVIARKLYESYSDDLPIILLVLLGVICVIFTPIFFFSGLNYLLNPEINAIRILLGY